MAHEQAYEAVKSLATVKGFGTCNDCKLTQNQMCQEPQVFLRALTPVAARGFTEALALLCAAVASTR